MPHCVAPRSSTDSLIIRPPNQFDAPAFASFLDATGADDLGVPDGSTRPCAYFDITLWSRRLERIFHQLNAPSAAEPASAYIDAALQLSFPLNARTHTTKELAIRIRQPQLR